MKIVMFTDAYWPRVNGVTVSVDSFSHALIRSGHEVMIVCSFYPESSIIERISGPPKEENAEGEPRIIRVPSMPFLISKEDRIAKFTKGFWVSKQLEAFDPDIIHINTEFVIAVFGFQYAFLHRLPVVFTFHTLWADYVDNYFPLVPDFILQFMVRQVMRNIIRRADLIITPTPQIQDLVRKYNAKKTTYLLPTGIDPKIFSCKSDDAAAFRERMEQRFPRLRGKRILLFAGRIAREKNISFLLDIAPIIVKKHPDAIFLIAGNGPDLVYYEEEAQALNVAEHCIFPGYLDRQDLALIYAMSEIFVFPSLTETQGLVTIEAMISGIPVVAIGAMGTITVMNGDNGGFMVKNDQNEFIQRVFELLEDPDLYQRKVAEARVHAQAWTIDTMAAKLEQVYHVVIDAFPKSEETPFTKLRKKAFAQLRKASFLREWNT
jgi:glycosyltransferase involved in cell wall biosynthesis